jgi:hypothetical protein
LRGFDLRGFDLRAAGSACVMPRACASIDPT